MSEKESFWHDLKSGKFASMVSECAKGQQLSNSDEVYNIMKPMFARQRDVESFYCIFMDAKNHIITIEKLSSGSISSAPIYPREIVKRLIALKASAIVAAHNHPSGSTDPSPEDVCITVKINIALASIDASLHDHIIIGNGYYSLADSGCLQKAKDLFTDFLRSIQ